MTGKYISFGTAIIWHDITSSLCGKEHSQVNDEPSFMTVNFERLKTPHRSRQHIFVVSLYHLYFVLYVQTENGMVWLYAFTCLKKMITMLLSCSAPYCCVFQKQIPVLFSLDNKLTKIHYNDEPLQSEFESAFVSVSQFMLSVVDCLQL